MRGAWKSQVFEALFLVGIPKGPSNGVTYFCGPFRERPGGKGFLERSQMRFFFILTKTTGVMGIPGKSILVWKWVVKSVSEFDLHVQVHCAWQCMEKLYDFM